MLVDIKHMIFDKAILELISYCTFNPTKEKLDKICDMYLNDSSLSIFGYYHDKKIVGIVGIRTNIEKSIILHISVDPDVRNSGIGRKIINRITSELSLRAIEAETDDDAVGFYKNCGFTIVDIGEKYKGTRRYKCSLVTLWSYLI